MRFNGLTFATCLLFELLRLEGAPLLLGSLLLFVVLSVAMWLTLNLHRPQAIPPLAPQARE